MMTRLGVLGVWTLLACCSTAAAPFSPSVDPALTSSSASQSASVASASVSAVVSAVVSVPPVRMVKEPPIVLWSEEPTIDSVPKTPLRLQRAGERAVEVRKIGYKKVGNDHSLVFSEGSGRCGLEWDIVIAGGQKLSKGALLKQAVRAEKAGYAIEITRWVEHSESGKMRFDASFRLIAFGFTRGCDSVNSRVWVAGYFDGMIEES